MKQTRETLSMPHRDPSIWQQMMAALGHVWPQVYAALMACVVSVVRGIKAGGQPLKTTLEAILCGCLTLASMPVLEYFGFGQSLAVAVGAAIGFLGTEWIREQAGEVAGVVLGRWRK